MSKIRSTTTPGEEVNPPGKLQSMLVCPICKHSLAFTDALITCSLCHSEFPQTSPDWVDLLPDHRDVPDEKQWHERQVQMEEWYKGLVSDPRRAGKALMNDYMPHARYLATLSGSVLDIGGGVGLVRHFLPGDTSYIVLDPSLSWLDIEWKSLSECFPCLQTLPDFVRGLGENLPFPAESFDAVLAFWSVNHAKNPPQVMHEVARVLRPGGRFLVVLEDMVPRWRDLLDRQFPAEVIVEDVLGCGGARHEKRARLYLMLKRLRAAGWPLQTDHVRIRESDLLRWIGSEFDVGFRRWAAQFLTFEFRKVAR